METHAGPVEMMAAEACAEKNKYLFAGKSSILPKWLNSLSNFQNPLEVGIRLVDIYSSALTACDAVGVVRCSFLSFYLYFEVAEHISVLHLLQTLHPLPSIDLDV